MTDFTIALAGSLSTARRYNDILSPTAPILDTLDEIRKLSLIKSWTFYSYFKVNLKWMQLEHHNSNYTRIVSVYNG